MISSKSVSICNPSHARRANSGKITISLLGYPYLMPWFEGNLLTQRHQITSLETRDPRLPCDENPESLSDLGLIRYRVVTSGRRTDRQNSHSLYALSAVPAGAAFARENATKMALGATTKFKNCCKKTCNLTQTQICGTILGQNYAKGCHGIDNFTANISIILCLLTLFNIVREDSYT